MLSVVATTPMETHGTLNIETQLKHTNQGRSNLRINGSNLHISYCFKHHLLLFNFSRFTARPKGSINRCSTHNDDIMSCDTASAGSAIRPSIELTVIGPTAPGARKKFAATNSSKSNLLFTFNQTFET